MSFYLNESGGNVTITYEDNSINSSYNGTTTGTNLSAGIHTFSLGTHTSYTISVYKVGAGVPTLISSNSFTPRGVAVNTRPASRYFGTVYGDASGAGGIYVMNPDLSFTYGGVRSAGVSWANNGLSPYRLSVAADDTLFVGDASSANAGVFRIDPTVSSNQVFLGPIGEQNGINAGVFGTIQSRPLVMGNPADGPVNLADVDGDLNPPGGNGFNSLLIYTNINPLAVPYEKPPSILGPDIGVTLNSETLGDNEYPGLSQGTNGYVYASTYRNNLSNPLLQIYETNDYAQIWNSYYNGGGADYFLTTEAGITQGIIDSAVSSDGLYVAGVTIDNWFVICPLTNGIPNTANLYLSTPTSYTGNARGIAFDAADNLYLSSSGIGQVQGWSLGLTTTAVTSGDTNGSTAFELVLPSNGAFVTVGTNTASQGGSDGATGTPSQGSFTITRTNAEGNYSTPMVINFTLTGTATNGVYTTVPAGLSIGGAIDSITLPAGVTSTNIAIIPTTNNIPRASTTVTLNIVGGASYTVDLPFSGSVTIQNTSTNQFVISAIDPSMYKAFSNDFAAALITRLGDTNQTVTLPASDFTYSGSAVSGVDFVPVSTITFNAGDLTHLAEIFPLSNGVPPLDTTNPVYVGNKSVTVTLNSSSGGGYILGTSNTTLTLIDNAVPPVPLAFQDMLTNAADAANWNITYASSDASFPADYNVQFGYDLTANNGDSGANGLIGLPPGGATSALRINCNQNSNPGAEGGVNVYYTNKMFGGNFAVRFYMNNVQGYGQYQVGGPLFGINHNGMESNWWESSGPVPTLPEGPWASDGVWYWMDSTPGGTASDYMEFTGDGPLPNTGWTQLGGLSYTSFEPEYKDPQVFTTVLPATSTHVSGLPANMSPLALTVPPAADNDWVDVEIDQVNGVVTMMMDKTVIFTYTNTTTFTNGYLMLGYNCPDGGVYGQYINTPDQAAYFSDLRVTELGPNIVVEPVAETVGAGTNFNFTITTGYASSAVTNQLYGPSGTPVGAPVIVSSPGGLANLPFVGNASSNGNYYIVVSDASGSVTSSVVALTIVNPPQITSEPQSITNNAHTTATFTVSATGSSLAYQWYSNNVTLTNGGGVGGVSTASLTLTNITSADQATYTVTVSNLAGMVTSTPATLTVIVPPSPTITGARFNGTNFTLEFTVGDQYDTTNSFTLESSTNLAATNDGFTQVTSGVTFVTNDGSITVTVPTNSAPDTFYRLLHN